MSQQQQRSGSVFPGTHSTAVAPPGGAVLSPERRIYINSGYLRSLHGMLKIAQMVLGIILFICTMVSLYAHHNRANYLCFVALLGFWTSGVLLFLYVINVVTYLAVVPWVKLELGYTAIMTLFCFIGGCLAADGAAAGMDAPFGAAAFFSFLLMCVFGFNAFVLYRLHSKGVRLVTTETTTISIPK